MAVRVFVPSLLRPLCGGTAELEVAAGRFGNVITEIDARCPGFAERVTADGRLRPDLAVAVNGEMMSLGFHEAIPDGAEIAIVPALGGG